MYHPDVLFTLAQHQHQDRRLKAETRRLARAARQNQASYLRCLVARLFAATRQWGQLQARLKPGQLDGAGTEHSAR